MIPVSTYALIFGIPIFVVIFSVVLAVVGKKIFGDKKEEDNNK